jgi:hypothetical protein
MSYFHLLRLGLLSFALLWMLICAGSWGPNPNLDSRIVQRTKPVLASVLPEIHNFRCVVVGDSQTTDTSAERIRTQTHRWDGPIIGELVCTGAAETGFLVNNGSFGIAGLSYRDVDLDQGWGDSGPQDFFAQYASEWAISEDISVQGARIGRYRLRFGAGNAQAPWKEPWGIGNNLIARIAVRTSPRSVTAIETRAERGGVVSFQSRTIHPLSKQWGVQIIEQPIPASINPLGDDVGIGIFLPENQVETPGQVLQVLGVLIERVGTKGQRLPGAVLTYQGRGGWSIIDHINFLSDASRTALAEMTQANTVLFALGHNPEGGALSNIDMHSRLLVTKWESAFSSAGLARPRFIYLGPWMIDSGYIQVYLSRVEDVYRQLANEHRGDLMISYQQLFDDLRPDDFDPARYQLDIFGTHPGNVSTAVNLAQDLYEMLFEGRRE